MAVDSSLYLHDLDKAALQALKSIPGFTPLLKAYMKVWNEKQFHIINMSSNLRLNEKQMSKYYNMLPPICETLGIEIPELYMQLNVNPNSYTYGDTKPYVVITSGLLETLPDSLISTVLAHECGHIACHHTLYRTMGRMILRGTGFIAGITTLATLPIQIAFAHWMRCSEFSADRAAMLCDKSPDKMMEVCMRFAGYDKDIDADADIQEFMNQAVEYKQLVNNSKWNKTLEFLIFNQSDHPLTAVRAYECNEWSKSEQFKKLINYINIESSAAEESEMEEGACTELPVPDSEKRFIGNNWEIVQQQLEDTGFTNVVILKKSEKGLMTREGQVLSVSINGETGFRKGDWFTADSKILVTYYAPETPEEIAEAHQGKIQVPDSSKQYIGRDYWEVVMELRDAGFSVIVREGRENARKGRGHAGAIVKMTIAGQDHFNKGDWFEPDSTVRIYYNID